MGYESFDGGSHDPHRWVAVGTETAMEYFAPVIPPPGERYQTMGYEQKHWYIVRACQLCEAVWWQEYDREKAQAA